MSDEKKSPLVFASKWEARAWDRYVASLARALLEPTEDAPALSPELLAAAADRLVLARRERVPAIHKWDF